MSQSISSNIGNFISTSSHHHGINSYVPNTIILNMENTKSVKVINGDDDILIIKDSHIVINNTDKFDIKELTNIFEYIKSDYPRVYSDLILKGIIK